MSTPEKADTKADMDKSALRDDELDKVTGGDGLPNLTNLLPPMPGYQRTDPSPPNHSAWASFTSMFRR